MEDKDKLDKNTYRLYRKEPKYETILLKPKEPIGPKPILTTTTSLLFSVLRPPCCPRTPAVCRQHFVATPSPQFPSGIFLLVNIYLFYFLISRKPMQCLRFANKISSKSAKVCGCFCFLSSDLSPHKCSH